jgi:hypothetical protein
MRRVGATKGDSMPAGSSSKRERQYEHIKESYKKRGQKGRAEEIAARTVNKERAEAGETKGASKSSGKASSASKSSSSGKSSSSRKSSGSSGRASASSGKSSSRSSSKPSASSGKSSSSRSSSSSKPGARSSGGERTREQLYQEARKRGVEGRSTMNKAQLERALSR